MIIGESLAPHTHLEILILCILFFSVVVVGGGSRKIPRNFYGTNTIFINAFEQHQHTHTHKWNTQGFSVRNSSELKKKKDRFPTLTDTLSTEWKQELNIVEYFIFPSFLSFLHFFCSCCRENDQVEYSFFSFLGFSLVNLYIIFFFSFNFIFLS